MSGNGQQFIFILKDILKELTSELNAKFEEVSKIAGAVTEAPEEMDAQLKNCKIEERRIGTAISFILTWDYSDVENYDSAEIYIKEAQGDIATPIQWDTLEYSKIIRTTKTNTYTVTGINAGYVYQITFLAKNTFGSVSDKSEAPTLIYAVSALNNVPDPPLDFNVYFTRDGVLWKWTQPADLDYAYAELRTDDDAGDADGLLEITQDTTSTVLPPYREGTAYLFNKGYGDRYSTPITCPWSKPVPSRPQSFKAEATFRGILFTYSQIPEDCIGICISINGEKHYTQDDSFTYYVVMGAFTVKAAYYDCFGEGIWTAEQTVNVWTEIDPDWLEDEAITLEKVDQTIKDAVKDAQDSVGKIEGLTQTTGQLQSTISRNKEEQDAQNQQFVTQITQTNNQITSVAADLSNVEDDVSRNYSAILQNTKDIALRVRADDIINQINISKEGIRIDGNKVHISGDTIFDNGVIVSKYIGDKQVVGTLIADGAITTEKISANAVTAGQIASNAVTTDKIEADAITSDKIQTGAITADKIESGAITSDKLTAGAVTADKLAANEIEMAGELKIVGGDVTLDENGLTVDTSTGSKVQFGSNGMIFIDTKGNTFSGIGRFCTGMASDGQYVRFASPWDVTPSVCVFPMEIQTSDVNYEHVNIYQRIRAYNISTTGFNVQCQSILGSGSSSSDVTVNQTIGSWDATTSGYYSYKDEQFRNDFSGQYTPLNTVTHIGITFTIHKINKKFEGYTRWANVDFYMSARINNGATMNFGKIATLPDYSSSWPPPSSDNDYNTGMEVTATWYHEFDFAAGATLYFTFYTIGSDSYDGDSANGRCHRGYIEISKIRYSTSQESILKRGTVGFIATDPNTVPYTVE